jgi:tRNA A-37 threonylcarbamoyl transferase component Bud32
MRRFAPLKIQIDELPTTTVEDARTTEEILRQKIGPSAILDNAILINTEINQNDDVKNAENIQYIIDVVKNHEPIVMRRRRNFDTGENSTPSYKSYIYKVGDSDILKVINYDCNALSDYVIIKEIAAQKYAETLSSLDKCNFETPSTTKIGRISVPTELRDKYDFSCLFFIRMSQLSYRNLENSVKYLNLDEDCENVASEINRVVSCLEDNKLYHNDLHGENILLNDENGKFRVGLLDYGNASEKQVKLVEQYNCETLKRMKRMSPTTVSEFPNGGRKKKMKRKTVKRQRKTKRNRRRKTKSQR